MCIDGVPAVPVNATTRAIIAALVRGGRVRRAFLGLITSPAPLPEPLRRSTGQDSALRVVEVIPGSPARRAGGAHRFRALSAARSRRASRSSSSASHCCPTASMS